MEKGMYWLLLEGWLSIGALTTTIIIYRTEPKTSRFRNMKDWMFWFGACVMILTWPAMVIAYFKWIGDKDNA